jgi:hypothetical protein
MKAWKLAAVLLVLGTTSVCMTQASAGFLCCHPLFPVMPRADMVDLRWKFEANKPFYVQIRTRTDQTMKVSGMDVMLKQVQTNFLRVTPEKKDDKGNWILGLEIIGTRFKNIDVANNNTIVEYDSEKARFFGPGTALDIFKALEKFKFKGFLAPDMTISRLEGANAFIREFANRPVDPLLQTMFSESAIKKIFEPVFPPVPQRPVKKGEIWTGVSDLDLGPIGSYKTTSKYSYQGTKDNLDRIKVESRSTYTPPARKGNLPFQITGGALGTPKTLPGEILFDRARGRLVSASIPINLEGSLNIELGGMNTLVELVQSQTMTVTVTDRDPMPAKPE